MSREIAGNGCSVTAAGTRCAGFARAAALLGITVLSLAGCDRRVRLRSADADSAATMSPDSVAILARDVQTRWDSGIAPEEAARLSATLLAADLARRAPGEWDSRTRSLLDSLAIGAELASAPCIEAVNFFSRSNPEGGSWPYLLWCGDRHPHLQALEGRGLHLQSAMLAPGPAASTPPNGPGGPTASAIALLFNHRVGGALQPLAMVWGHSRRDENWNLVQTLGADSLGGTGTAQFTARDTSLDLVTQTYQPTRGFDECATCPHVYRTRRFHWQSNGFARVEDRIVASPYATFVLFIAALGADDRETCAKLVSDGSLVDRARKLDWGKPLGTWRLAPETDESANSMVFFRGKEEAYRVQFVNQDDNWLISGFDPTARTIE
jgi:hypothetical protein